MGERLNGQCMRRSRFFCQRGEGESKHNGEKTALFFCLFWDCLVQNFPAMPGGGGGGDPTIYEGGGGKC